MSAYTDQTIPLPSLAAYIEATTTEQIADAAQTSLLIQGVEGDDDAAALAWLLFDPPTD